jgi:hypothetical protein
MIENHLFSFGQTVFVFHHIDRRLFALQDPVQGELVI